MTAPMTLRAVKINTERLDRSRVYDLTELNPHAVAFVGNILELDGHMYRSNGEQACIVVMTSGDEYIVYARAEQVAEFMTGWTW